MRRQVVYFIVPPRTLLLDLAGPAEALSMANRYQKEVHFEIRYAGPSPRIQSSIGLQLAGITPLPIKIERDAMIVVAGITGLAPEEETEAGRNLIAKWLRRIARPTQRLVFICSGALLAAKAGLLADRNCTTHHSDCDGLRKIEPAAKVLDNRIYVVDGNIYTSAGVTAGVDLMLHLISEIAGPLCAVSVARNMVIYMRRTGADPQLSPWLDSRNHIHPVVHRVQDAISSDPAHSWTLRQLSSLANSSPRHVSRLFQIYTGTSPVTYINRLRVDLARQLLTNSQLGLDHVAQRAGFSSIRHFRRIWQQYNAISPGRWRQMRQEN
ncbi:MAG: AraC family transcriptional regulator [Acidobacteria bacterium]|nr:MAG: AraC family transcriptional regulator [Acidobacteriota bacterium]